MKELIGDLFEPSTYREFPYGPVGRIVEWKPDAICITTNGFVKKNGEAVMGRGCALEANKRSQGVYSKRLGRLIKKHGLKVDILGFKCSKEKIAVSGSISEDGEEHINYRPKGGYYLISFPVKDFWFNQASLKLIKESARQLIEIADKKDWKKIVIPRPGCKNGGLKWKDVKFVLDPILDDRFYIITNDMRF